MGKVVRNLDHVAIVIHNYRWRIALAEGEPKYDVLEKRLAESPVITVPTITLEGDANGAPQGEPSAYAKKFSGKYAHRTITAVSDTICRKKLRKPLPKPSSMSTSSDRHQYTCHTDCHPQRFNHVALDYRRSSY